VEPLTSSPLNQARVTLAQTSRIVAIVDGAKITEVTTHNPEGELIETCYYIRGREVRDVKAGDGDGQRDTKEVTGGRSLTIVHIYFAAAPHPVVL